MFTSKNLAVAASVVLMAVLVYIASFGIWVTNDIADTESFTESAVAAFETESSRVAISQLVVDRITNGRPLLSLVGPLLVDSISGLLGGERLQVLLTRLTAVLHTILFDGRQDGIVVDLTPVGERLMPPLELLFPRLADEIPDDIFREFVLVEPGTVPELSPYAKAARALTWVAVVLAAVLAVVMIVLRTTKWKGVLSIGIGVVVGSLAAIVTVGRGRTATLGVPRNPNVEVLMANLYDELASGLKSFAGWTLAIGVLIIGGSLVYGSLWGTDGDADDAAEAEDTIEVEANPGG